MYTVIDGNCFKNMLVGAYQLFQKKYEIINQLNVFPVPDGDTGNNMLNTLKSMYSMIAEVSPEEPVGIIAEKAAAGAIMGHAEILVSSFRRSFMASAVACMARRLPPADR